MADKALLSGINRYQKISALRGCLNDVESMKTLLTASYGFAGGTVRTLTEGEVVKANIEEGWAWLLDGAEVGDRRMFHFSGHGGYMPSQDDDEAVDELLCLYDMDWDDEGSYLLDDELRAMLSRVPAGVRMTVVLDSCHSGSGTRAAMEFMREVTEAAGGTRSEARAFAKQLDIDPKALVIVGESRSEMKTDFTARLSRGGVRAARPSEMPPLARFVAHPDLDPHEVMTRRTSFTRARAEMAIDNHLLLAAARDDQTAADAFIDGKSQGAFTHHLCKAARSAGASRPVASIFEAAARAIAKGFSQVPQIEGVFRDEPLFGKVGATGVPTITTPSSHGSAATPLRPASPTGSGVGPANAALAADLVRVHEKFLDALARLLGEGRAGAGALRAAAGARHIAYVHGINTHPKGYATELRKALSRHLTSEFGHIEVHWSDIVNARNVAARDVSRAEIRQVDRIREELEQELERRVEAEQRAYGGSRSRSARRAGDAEERGLIFDHMPFDDFPRYLASKAVRDAVIARFVNEVGPPLARGEEVDVIAHSWGTVVAYEALQRMARQGGHAGRVRCLFTLGSALAWKYIQAQLEGEGPAGLKPALVDRWINVDAVGDPVGGPLEGRFDGVDDWVGVPATGCGSMPWLKPVCAHSSYFDVDNVVVNRDIIAAALEA